MHLSGEARGSMPARGLLRAAGRCGLLVALGACSTIVRGPTRDIEVSSTPVSQADCTLSSGDAIYRVTTPGTVEVSRSGRSLSVACHKEGYQEGHATLDPFARVRVDLVALSGQASQQLFDLVLLGDDYAVLRHQEPLATS